MNDNDKQKIPSYTIKRNKDCIHAEIILKLPLFSAHKVFSDAKIGLKAMNYKEL